MSALKVVILEKTKNRRLSVILNNISTQEQEFFLRNFCRKNQNKLVMDAASALYSELAKQ